MKDGITKRDTKRCADIVAAKKLLEGERRMSDPIGYNGAYIEGLTPGDRMVRMTEAELDRRETSREDDLRSDLANARRIRTKLEAELAEARAGVEAMREACLRVVQGMKIPYEIKLHKMARNPSNPGNVMEAEMERMVEEIQRIPGVADDPPP